MIIDCHCHAGLGDGLTGPWDTAARLDGYIRKANAAGISRTVIFAAFHSDYRIANRQVGEIVRKSPHRFSGFAFIHALRDRGRVEAMVRESIDQFRCCGIKVHRHDGPISRELCGVAEKYSLPVLYDPMGEVNVVDLVAQEYPKVNFVIPHLSSFADDWRAQKAFLDLLTRYPNVYTDTSGVRRFDLLEEALARAGASKILFGSDGPWLHPGVELSKVLLLTSNAKARRMILSENWLRLTEFARNRNGQRNFTKNAPLATV